MTPVEDSETSVDITTHPDLAIALLWPYMAHPDDQVSRERVTAYLWSCIAVDNPGLGLEFSGEMLARLSEAAAVGVGNDLADAGPGGCIAGDNLLHLLELSRIRAGELVLPPVTEAAIDAKVRSRVAGGGTRLSFHITSSLYRHLRDRSGARYRATPETVREHWLKYRRVSHLWAAYLMLIREHDLLASKSPFEFDGRKLGGIAMALREVGVARRLPNGEAVLPESALVILNAPAFTVGLDEVSPYLAEAVASYSPGAK